MDKPISDEGAVELFRAFLSGARLLAAHQPGISRRPTSYSMRARQVFEKSDLLFVRSKCGPTVHRVLQAGSYISPTNSKMAFGPHNTMKSVSVK